MSSVYGYCNGQDLFTVSIADITKTKLEQEGRLGLITDKVVLNKEAVRGILHVICELYTSVCSCTGVNVRECSH